MGFRVNIDSIESLYRKFKEKYIKPQCLINDKKRVNEQQEFINFSLIFY
jgi:hypothetical protein